MRNLLYVCVICMSGLACGEDELSPREAGGEISSSAGEMFGGETVSGAQTGGQELNAGREGEGGAWVTLPPREAGEQVDVTIEWGAVDLSGLGLIIPDDQEDEGLPLGEDLCVYEPPAFVIDHPQARTSSQPQGREVRLERPAQYEQAPARIAHPDQASVGATRPLISPKLDGVVLPSHVNDMPLSDRATVWSTPRCYQLGPFDSRLAPPELGGVLLTEEQAYDMYLRLVRMTLWREVDQRLGQRTVIGLRGAYPGSLHWHHNTPNQYNDTLVLLWRDEAGLPHVREFPVNTDTGVYDFGVDNSSSLRPNRHYPYINGWHRDYHALQIDLPSYPVRDDTNNNGHWDSERNGWLEGPQPGQDYDRLGTAHNIHAGNEDGPLEGAEINIASAGCQVIPGMANWLAFLEDAWTGFGDSVDYFLIDVRDISPRFWMACQEGDGSHACPWLISQFPYTHSADTTMSDDRWHDNYSCDEANESGAEQVYILNLPAMGNIHIEVLEAGEGVDPDIHLLEGGDDASACRARGHRELDALLPAGRYLIVVDTWVNASGAELAGGYQLKVQWSPQ